MTNTEAQELKIYEVANKNSGEKRKVAGVNQMDCCRQLGWKIGDCFIVEVKPISRRTGKDKFETLVCIPCQVCPFQYAECIKPPEIDCASRPEAPELQEWLKQVAKAHLCLYVGVAINKVDYFVQQKWCPIEQAIVELAHRR